MMIAIFLFPVDLFAYASGSRYFHTGDGRIHLRSAKNGLEYRGTYRLPDGSHERGATGQIQRVFSAASDDPLSKISPRLIEFFDYIEDKFSPGATITIVSGYRSPSYNTNLRSKGKLAAKASLHQYGMAADIALEGASSKAIWEHVRDLGFGGAGYYQGANVHLDVGPARFWDQNTSGVGSGAADDNKLIELVADKDIYRPSETVTLRFIRMTAFPIGVSDEFVLEKRKGADAWKGITKFNPFLDRKVAAKCPDFANIGEMLGIRWQLPKKLKSGRYRIRSTFCDNPYEGMPASITTPEFEVIR